MTKGRRSRQRSLLCLRYYSGTAGICARRGGLASPRNRGTAKPPATVYALPARFLVGSWNRAALNLSAGTSVTRSRRSSSVSHGSSSEQMPPGSRTATPIIATAPSGRPPRARHSGTRTSSRAGPGTGRFPAGFAEEVTFWAACRSSRQHRRERRVVPESVPESWEEPVVYAVCAPRIRPGWRTASYPGWAAARRFASRGASRRLARRRRGRVRRDSFPRHGRAGRMRRQGGYRDGRS